MDVTARPFGSWSRCAALLVALACAGLAGSAAAGAGRAVGSHLVFRSDRTGTWRLYGLNADGSGLADLGPPASSLLPDGRLIRSAAPSHIVLVDENGRQRRDLGSGEPLAVSPDERRIAFFDLDKNDNGAIGVVELDGSHRRILVRSPQQDDRLVGWLPDSSSLLVLRPGPGFLLGRDRLLRAGRRVSMVLRGSFDSPAVSARGLVAFTRLLGPGRPQRLLVLDPSRPNVTSVVATASTLGPPEWSPDGRRLAFVRDDGSRSVTHTLVIASGGRRTTLLTSALFIQLGLNAWSPSGDELAVVVGYASGPQLVVVGVDGHVRARVRSKNVSTVLQWSPDGSAIAFGSRDLFVVRRDGIGLRRLTTAGDNELLGWAPGRVPRSVARAAPLPPTELVTGLTLRSRGRVEELSADGSWVAAIVGRTRRDCDHVVAWRAGAPRSARFSRSRPCDGNEEAIDLALSGTHVTWSSFYCGNDCYLTPVSADTGRPGREDVGQEQDVGNSGPAPTRPPPPAETHGGIAVSVVGGRIRLERVADGDTIAIKASGRLVDAELEDTGLFYAYNVAQGPMPGRVKFIPFAELARRF